VDGSLELLLGLSNDLAEESTALQEPDLASFELVIFVPDLRDSKASDEVAPALSRFAGIVGASQVLEGAPEVSLHSL
jgi:hypothetical protein